MRYFLILIIGVTFLLTSCTQLPKQKSAENCSFSVIQNNKQALGTNQLTGLTFFMLKKEPFIIEVSNASCQASIATYSQFENMRTVGATKNNVFTTSGFEMAGSPDEVNKLPPPRDGQTIPPSEFKSMFGDEGMKNYESVCKSDGKCPKALMAFRSYHNFIDQKTNQYTNRALIKPDRFQPTSFILYMESKRFLHSNSNGNWPADILLKPNPILITFSN